MAAAGPWLAAAGVLLMSARPAAGQGAGGVTSEQVRRAVGRAVAYVRQRQRGDGSWPDYHGHRGGVTALSVLGLLQSGVESDDPAVAGGVAALGRVPDQATYVVSLKSQAYAALNSPAAMGDLRASAAWLIRAQQPTGMWTYGVRGSSDNSNTQFALLGLHEAAKAGVAVPKAVWERSRLHFTRSQNRDGGWGYRARNSSRGSMSTAGLASLFICGQRLHVGGARVFRNGAYPGCGRYRQNVVLAKGIEWMTDNFSVRQNPGYGLRWLYYYLYGLERVGMISGRRSFGDHDWYREGAAYLVAQQRHDGSWAGNVPDTVFALLFLSKGNRPVLIQKLEWRGLREPSWNRNIHDLENLTAFIDDKFGKRTTWQTTTLALPLAELRVSPILFITGHEFPALDGAARRKLRAYVETGGTILADACCGSREFADAFRQFARRTFPEYRLKVLEADHPVFKSYYRIEELYGLEGIDIGCRTGVFLSPNALSCLWELQTIPTWSARAFKLGTNIAAYATGKELLQDKLDVVELPAERKAADAPAEVPRGAVRIARLIHNGDYKADVHAESHLAAMLRDKAKVDVVARGRHLRATDEKLFEYPVVFMTGHYSFELPAAEIAALRLYLDRGGCLIADACCGRKAFDRSFRQMVRKLYPAKAFEPLPAGHPVLTGQVGVPLGELRYRRILADELKQRGTARPPIEAVIDAGRTLVLYSKYDFSCALEGDSPYSCRGYVDADGRKLALNLFLYAISY